MNLLRNGVLCLLLLLFCFSALAYKPENYLASETQLIYEGEGIGTVYVVPKGEDSYYVVELELEDETSGYIALPEHREEVVTDNVLSKQLFQTAEFHNEYQTFKKQVADNPGLIWFIANWEEVSTISTKIEAEGIDFIFMRDKLDGKGADILSEMESRLSDISDSLTILRNKMSAAETLEGSFLTAPEAGSESDLKNANIECYDYLERLHELNLEYSVLAKGLGAEIATNTDLSVEEMKQVSDAANLPAEFDKIETWYSHANNMKLEKTMQNIYLNATKSSADFADAIQTRLKRQDAFNSINSLDVDFKKKTDNKFESLAVAFESITADSVYGKWKDKTSLAGLEAAWKKTISRFSSGNYDKSMESASLAKKAAVAVLDAGQAKEDPDGIDSGLLITGVVLIIIFLIVLIIVRKREELGIFISGNSEDDRVEFNDFP